MGLLTLYVADTETDTIIPLAEPGVIPFFEDRLITVFAEASFPGQIGSVRLDLPGVDARFENAAPYALFGDAGGDFAPGVVLTPGSYTLSVTVFSEINGGGQVLEAADIPISVEPPPPGGAPPAAFEVGEATVAQADPEEWHSVTFAAPIPMARVVLGPLSLNGPEDATLRVRNVTDTGFEFQIDEWDYLNGRHLPETIAGWP